MARAILALLLVALMATSACGTGKGAKRLAPVQETDGKRARPDRSAPVGAFGDLLVQAMEGRGVSGLRLQALEALVRLGPVLVPAADVRAKMMELRVQLVDIQKSTASLAGRPVSHGGDSAVHTLARLVCDWASGRAICPRATHALTRRCLRSTW